MPIRTDFIDAVVLALGADVTSHQGLPKCPELFFSEVRLGTHLVDHKERNIGVRECGEFDEVRSTFMRKIQSTLCR